jgi:16S rRNA (uracil1498-N3)-methyltransferase
MVDRIVSLPTFITTEPFAAGQQIQLTEEDAHHIRVRRLDVGTRVALLNGEGLRGTGQLVRLAKKAATVEVATAEQEAPRREVHLLLPIAEKDRMLWLAEKATELGVSSWRPVVFRRSKSVASRGEGLMFTQKVVARMHSAMEQSGNAWMPTVFPEANVERAIAAAPTGCRFVLDGAGVPLMGQLGDSCQNQPIAIVAGPEGGIEDDELEKFVAAGFVKASIGSTILRFETAAVAGLAVVQASTRSA